MTFSELKVTLGQSGVFLQLFSSLSSSFQPLSTLLSLAQGSQSAHFLQPRTTTLLFFFSFTFALLLLYPIKQYYSSNFFLIVHVYNTIFYFTITFYCVSLLPAY